MLSLNILFAELMVNPFNRVYNSPLVLMGAWFAIDEDVDYLDRFAISRLQNFLR